MRYLSAVCFGLVAASAAAHAQTAGNPVELYSNGYRIFGDLKGIGLYGLPVNSDGLKPTYTVSSTYTIGVGAAAELCGSSTKSIRARAITIAGASTTAGTLNLILVVRSTADTGGTFTTPTPLPSNAADAAATGTVKFYTAVPTGGTALGQVYNAPLQFPLISSTLSPLVVKFGGDGSKSIVLTGAASCLDVSFTTTASAPTAPSIYVTETWTEE